MQPNALLIRQNFIVCKKAGVTNLPPIKESRPRDSGSVTPRSENEETKPPYVCPGCSNHTHGNNMINRCNVINKRVILLT
jgi:hypothetical protein